MSEHAQVSEEHRKLAACELRHVVFAHLRRQTRDQAIEELAQIFADLADREREVAERVRKETLEEAGPAICHLAWCAYQLGCNQPYNENATEAQLASLRNGLEAFAENPSMTAEENHENWMRYKLSQGWIYGEVKDEQKKTHPDLVAFSELPEVERNKDIMDLMARRTIRALAAKERAK